MASEYQFTHRPVEGLPSSLLEKDNHTIAVIALMQRAAGLNREVRRSIEHDEPVSPAWRARLQGKLSKPDERVATHYLSPAHRCSVFWFCMKRRANGDVRWRGGRAYATAVDIQLLTAYEPTWMDLTLDEAALSAACPPWTEIREGLENWLKSFYAHPPLGVFMLWPKIVQDLERWDSLGATERKTLSYAIFSLSSVGWTDWFIREALSKRPELHDELGGLIEPPRQTNEVEMRARPMEDSVSMPEAWRAEWSTLLERLGQLSETLRERPTIQSVADLELLCTELRGAVQRMPDDRATEKDRIRAAVHVLIAFCRQLQEEPAFAWLADEFVERIAARWDTVEKQTDNVEGLTALAEDAQVATSRTELTATQYRSAWQQREDLSKALDELSTAIATARPLERRALAAKKSDGSRRLLDAEDELTRLEDEFLRSATPFQEQFELTTESAGLEPDPKLKEPDGRQESWSVHPGGTKDGAEPSPVVDGVQKTPAEGAQVVSAQNQTSGSSSGEELAVSVEVPLGPNALSATVNNGTNERARGQLQEGAASTTQERDGARSANGAPTNRAQFEPVTSSSHKSSGSDTEDPYSVGAGEQCSPIWSLLREHHFALAYQFARALSLQEPGVKVPPVSLLGAVALANELVLPDGAVSEVLPHYLAEIDEKDFLQEGPHAWHTALNLLLVAATLRPMVLAPAAGAATVASYLHLSNYPALYTLVTEIRSVSDRLQGFRIEPATLKAARSEAGRQQELKELRQAAVDWLESQAPAMTMKFAAATNVWRHWTKSNGVIHQLVSTVTGNKVAEMGKTQELVSRLSDPDEFMRLVRDTDRRELRRTKGEDIHSGALDQLERSVAEAVSYARRWIGLAQSSGQSGDRLRELLHDVRLAIDKAAQGVNEELGASGNGNGQSDAWGLVAAGRSVVLSQFRAMRDLFDPAAELPPAEPSAAEALARDVLLVPALHLAERWTLASTPSQVVAALGAWCAAPESWESAYRARTNNGDLFGAELIAQDYPDTAIAERWTTELKRLRESWRATLGRTTDEAQRELEVGRAYGFLTDEDLGEFETELVRWRTRAEQDGRFDEALAAIRTMRGELAQHRSRHTEQARKALAEINRTAEREAGIGEIERVIELGDVATANELLQRLREGKPVWPEQHEAPDLFRDFFPASVGALDGWLEANISRAAIEGAMRGGQKVGPLDFGPISSGQRDQAARLFGLWCDIKKNKVAQAAQLEGLLTGLAFPFKRVLAAGERLSGREVWSLETEELQDRSVCPVPHFGSLAKGRYRVICIWDQAAEEDILQLVGDATLQKPAIVLFFGRMKEQKRRDLSRLANTKRKSFLLLDELMLVYLGAQSISKLTGLFQLTLPFAYSTPYDPTAGLVPPEMFYGRSAELDAVKGLNGRCFIYGGRQLGKTALLRRAEHSFHSPVQGRFSRWIDLRAEGIGVSRQAEEIWICLSEQLKAIKVLDAGLPIPSPSRKGSIDNVIQELKTFLGRDSDRRILLLLDEADRFFEQDGKKDFAETRRLKQLMDETSRHFKVVFAGLHNVLRMTERANHPLAHFGEPIKVGPLVDEEEVKEAEDLVQRPMAASGFQFESRSLVIRVLAQTNYYPSLIQLYCSHLLRHMQSRLGRALHKEGPRYVITDKDIETVYSSGALRDEIRAKFRLTLQLDPRYEVIAYAMALAALKGTYKHPEGLEWKSIREAGALYWWPEGFQDTSELDFRVLLDEMVELGVLSSVRDGRYTLRNPNVLLLLGSQDEIEAVLVKDREPSVEFELSTFRSPLKNSAQSALRNPLTYQQLSALMRLENTVTAIAGSVAGGISELLVSLRDYVGETAGVIALDDCADVPSFTRSLDRALKGRDTEGNTLMVVPSSVPWSTGWMQAGSQKLNLLRSPSKFVSLVFLADPVTLWSAMSDRASFAGMQVPWMSLLPWTDEFVKHWLSEQQLPSEKETRQAVRQVTGYWPSALQELVADCGGERDLMRRIAARQLTALTTAEAETWAQRLGLSVHEPRTVLRALAAWGEPATIAEVAEVAETPIDQVEQVLRWADLLGLIVRGGGDYWSLDPFIGALLEKLNS